MSRHAPEGYRCPICMGIEGVENEFTMLRKQDKLYEDDKTVVFINSKFFRKAPGHVIVVPRKHFENLYELPEAYQGAIMQTAKKMAAALKTAYTCDGITLLQNNEPAGGQHAFHYHLHIIPRMDNDNLFENLNDVYVTTPEERMPFIEKIKVTFGA